MHHPADGHDWLTTVAAPSLMVSGSLSCGAGGPASDGRLLSLVLYLNDEWDDANGGALRKGMPPQQLKGGGRAMPLCCSVVLAPHLCKQINKNNVAARGAADRD